MWAVKFTVQQGLVIHFLLSLDNFSLFCIKRLRWNSLEDIPTQMCDYTRSFCIKAFWHFVLSVTIFKPSLSGMGFWEQPWLSPPGLFPSLVIRPSTATHTSFWQTFSLTYFTSSPFHLVTSWREGICGSLNTIPLVLKLRPWSLANPLGDLPR